MTLPLAAIIDCCYAPFVMITAWLMLSQQPQLTQVGGGLLVVAAVLIVMTVESVLRRRVAALAPQDVLAWAALAEVLPTPPTISTTQPAIARPHTPERDIGIGIA